MPVTPRAARRRSHTPQDADPPQESTSKLKTQGLYDSNSVQDRIRQWQVQGAADAADPDAVSVRSTPLSDHAHDRSRAQSPAESLYKSATGRRNRWADGDKENRNEAREESTNSAPRKRLISDEHWKAKRANQEKQSPRAALKETTPTPHHDLTYTSTPRKEERDARRERRKQARLSREHDRLNSGDLDTKDLATPPVAAQDLDSYIDDELARRLDTPPTQDHVEARGSPQQRSQSKYAESLGQADSPSQAEEFSKSKSKGAAVFFKTKEIFGRYEKPIAQRVPSIEAWLEEQPDPFIDNGVKVEVPAVEVPEPLKKRTRHSRRRSSSTNPHSDPNKIWESVTACDDSQDAAAPRRDTSWSYGDEIPVKESKAFVDQSGDSPSNLRRSAARTRKSRHEKSSPHSSTRVDDPQSRTKPSSPLAQPRPKAERTCPPTGAHRLTTIASVETFKEKNEPPAYDILPQAERPGLKRKLTTHEDLMSVLSLPMNRKSTRSHRRAKLQPSQSAAELLSSLMVEEQTYGKELRTLVDGVIPVLLQCVLSKSDSVAAAGLFTSSASGRDDLAFTKPIIDMGVALERLKTLHNRIPLENIDALLGWGHNAQKAYNDYLTAWRLGFHDVVVNLAPLEDGQQVDQGLSRDDDGDVVNAEGKKVDVAYLLKRPLVRVKNLSKTFEAVKEHSNRSLAQDVAQIFMELTSLARRRHQEEQARLEDEAAARIDCTRARDPRTLGVMTKASINPNRRVRARDCFNLTMYHSTGQRLDCRVEMILRDSAAGTQVGGDVLICEMDESGKWLLFPPVELHSISARRAEAKFDLVMMVRGPSGIGQEWHELLAVASDNPEAATEWMSMLGSNPLPPKLNRTQSFRGAENVPSVASVAGESTVGHDPAMNPTSEVDVPLGEPSVVGDPVCPTSRDRSNNPFERFMPRLNLGGGLQSKPQRFQPKQEKLPQRKPVASEISSDRSTISDKSTKELHRPSKPLSAPNTPTPASQPRPSQQQRQSTQQDGLYMMSGALPAQDKPSHPPRNRSTDSTVDMNNLSVQLSPPPKASEQASQESWSAPATPAALTEQRPGFARKLSATPSMELPTVNKLRSTSDEHLVEGSMPLNESIRDQWNAMSGNGRSRRRSGHKGSSRSQIYTEDIPSPPALSAHRASPQASAMLRSLQLAPAPPPHKDERTELPAQVAPLTPKRQVKSMSKQEAARKRRSSSPLKHEYAPSTASETSSESDSQDSSDSSSDTSEDFMSETQDVAMPLIAVTAGNRRSSKLPQQVQPPPSVAPTAGSRTLAPSDSASQGPYRKVPASSTLLGSKKTKTIALVCTWSDKGMWEQIYPDECSIVISPGLIEAFEMSAAHSGTKTPALGDHDSRTSSMTQQPLVAFELTPIVPLRRGTALDINIRSPPTANSKLRTTNNIMFRSRNVDECDTLYSMINWARCNNPTYIQLQSGRPRQPSVTFNIGQTQHPRTKSGSWFSFGGSEKRSSYRASSAPAPGLPSVGDNSEASIGTMNSAFSALRRLGVSSAFNLNRSSVTRKSGLSRTSGSLYSSDSGTRAGSGASTPQPSQMGFVPGKDGPNVPETSAEAANGGGMVNNMKIRLYVRKGQQWENLGAGRLIVMPAENTTLIAANSGQSTPTGATPSRLPSENLAGLPGSRGPRLASSSNTPHRIHGDGREKRIIVRKNKDDSQVLLDATLGESCFERVMQTGIAVKVWEEDEHIGDKGGVVLGREKVYMMQLPGTREAGWVFGLCGTYRYGVD